MRCRALRVPATRSRGRPAVWNCRTVCSTRSIRSRTITTVGPPTAGRVEEPQRGEGHSEGLAGALVVPDQALAAGRVHHPLVDRLDALDLRVPRDELLEERPAADLGAVVEDVVPQNRQHLAGREQQLDRPHDARAAREVPRVGRRPPHQPVLGGLTHRPVVELPALGRERQHVRREERRRLDLVDVVDVARAVQPRLALVDRRLRLADDEREAVHPQHDVEAPAVTGRLRTSPRRRRPGGCSSRSSKSMSRTGT